MKERGRAEKQLSVHHLKGGLRLEFALTAAQPISALSISVFSSIICVPQSSAVITQLKGSVNWDDGIEKEMNLCVCVRVGE